ncbi:hypothetical protein AB0I51_46540 [Streptomyces sp. NPDC050549]|uniref:hypothetical protein n=1 Tax=Streptomyces sp. NPDC050549 TaxID=3155406 RepID=UPI00344A5621
MLGSFRTPPASSAASPSGPSDSPAPRTSLTRAGLIAGVLGLALALSACGSGGGGRDVASAGGSKKPSAEASQTTGDPMKDRLKYAACMRKQGIDMPDPGADGQDVTIPADQEKFQAAVDKCKQYLPHADGQAPGYGAEQKAADLKVAQCLRSKGVNASDPTDDGHMNIPDGDSQKTKDALKACGGSTSGKTGQ